MADQENPEWWRVENFQNMFNRAADKTEIPEARQLYKEAAQNLAELAALAQKGSYGTKDGRAATLLEAEERVIAPANKVGALSRGAYPELAEGFEDVLKSFQFFGGHMWTAVEQTHDAAQAAVNATGKVTRKVTAPPTASFKKA